MQALDPNNKLSSLRVDASGALITAGGGGGGGGGATEVTLAALLAHELLAPSVSRQRTATSASASVALTTTCRKVRLHARGDAVRYSLNAAATATSHYLAAGESLVISVPASTVIHAIRGGAVDSNLEITEYA